MLTFIENVPTGLGYFSDYINDVGARYGDDVIWLNENILLGMLRFEQ
jgi:hypothetical protein